MQGQRVDYEGSGEIPGDGAFWFAHGGWWGTTPNGHVANLRNHQVVEHEDRTITVSPSILVRGLARDGNPPQELWHGFLERGVWRSC